MLVANYGPKGLNSDRLLKLVRGLSKEGSSEMAVNRVVLNTVMKAWASCDGGECRCETCLSEMEDVVFHENDNMAPDSDSYRIAIAAWRRSSNPFRFRRALDILRRMELQEKNGNYRVRVDEETRAMVLSCCAFIEADEAVEAEAFATAALVFEEVVATSRLPPKAATIELFAEACARLEAPFESRLKQGTSIIPRCSERWRQSILKVMKGVLPGTAYELLKRQKTIPTTAQSGAMTETMRIGFSYGALPPRCSSG